MGLGSRRLRGRTLLQSIGFLGLLNFSIGAAFAADSCQATFTRTGDAKTGIIFAGRTSVPGLAPRSAIAQMKALVAALGVFEIGQENVEDRAASLVVKQKQSEKARGFPVYIKADDQGTVSIEMSLPTGMNADDASARNTICGAWLDKLKPGTEGDALAKQGAAIATTRSASIAPVYNTPAQETTQMCPANFVEEGDIVTGRIYTTWAVASMVDPREAFERVKLGIAQPIFRDKLRVVGEEIHGGDATLSFSMDDVSLVSEKVQQASDAYLTLMLPKNNNKMAFPFEMQFDAALGAVAFVIRTNPQQNLDEDKLKWFACSTIALATATPMPEIPKKGGIHLRNPFKNERKEAEKAAIDHGENVQKTKDALYTRALASGKAIVIVPVLNPGIKYKDRPITDLTAGGEASPQYLMDTTSVIVWQNQDDAKSRLQVGVQTKLDEIGLRGALSHFYDAGTPNAEYFIYIVNPGTYRLLGNRYELARESIPKMSSARWSEKPAIGFASLVGKSNTEFYQTQQWFDATYGSKQVVDGSYCSIMVSTPSVVGCGQWQETSHTETTVVDPGGWRTVTDARKVDGLAIATKLTRDFASFKVAPGETILVDGLMATSHNTGIDTDACKQQADNLVGCAIANYTLYRIPAKKDAVDRNVPGDNFPGLRKAFAAAQYRPLKMSATAMESTPGTFEASWTQPYTLAVQKKK